MIKWSKKGSKDNRLRLVWSKYYKYIYKNKEYFFKEKAYQSYNDGWTEVESIKKQTYRNAEKKKKKCYQISVEENILEAGIEAPAVIFAEIYQVPIGKIKTAIVEIRDYLKERNTIRQLSKDEEYKIFIKKLEEKILKQ